MIPQHCSDKNPEQQFREPQSFFCGNKIVGVKNREGNREGREMDPFNFVNEQDGGAIDQ